MLFSQTWRESLISKLATNLPTLRAKIKISQSDLADAVGIGRQTLISIENGTNKMRWDTFLALMVILAKDPDAAELMELLDLKFEDICIAIGEDMCNRKITPQIIQDKLWTDESNHGKVFLRGFAPLPVGLINTQCPKCGSTRLRGALISENADQQDPNILCIDCGYWRD